MNRRLALIHFYCGVFVLSVVIPFLSGCNQTSEVKPQTERVKKLPKMQFHRPDSFPLAVERLIEIHPIIISDSPLPEPKKFQVVEVIHGSGAGAHSHYHLATHPSDHSHAHSDGHAVEESNEKNHEVQVDVITEMTDIIKWLPKIAGETDMDKDLWNSVKTESESMQTQLSGALSQATRQPEQRELIRGMENRLLSFNDSMTAIAKELKDTDRDHQELPED